LTFFGHGSQDRRASLRCHWIDRYDDATTVALVDTHAHAAHAYNSPYPAVFDERRIIYGFHENVRAKPLYIERITDDLTELSNSLGRDEGKGKSVEDAAVLPDRSRPFRAEFCGERWIINFQYGARRRPNDCT
jgi:hypothetical protein